MQTKTRSRERKPVPTAGYRPSDWAEAAGFSRQKYYALDNPPRSVKIDRMRIITESPADWLARIGGE
jgi:hypothetical protein